MDHLTLDSITQEDDAAWAPLARLAACHELLADVAKGPVLPPLWHWLHFLDAAPAVDLGPDGHRRRGGVVPHDPALPARMWAGGRLRFGAQPQAGARVRRETEVLGATERQGRSGKLRFMTLRHVVTGAAGMLVEEEQDLVFRAPSAGRLSPPVAAPAPGGAVTRVVIPDAVLLFRFSALTFNAHRIHYDAAYARSAEHYPDLVVHGPLQAMLLTALLRVAAPGATLRRFAFRGQAPAFVDRALQLEAWAEEGRWKLQTRDDSGVVCMVATAEGGEDVLF
jgi:hydroxyacyl-ACP dehydratase HTD2-like protein with hotdog domain